MAETVVNFVIEKLGPLLAQEMVFLSGVREEIRDIKLELEHEIFSERCGCKSRTRRF